MSAAPNAIREAFVEEMKNVFLGVAEIAQKAKNGASARDLYEGEDFLVVFLELNIIRIIDSRNQGKS